MIGTKRIVQMEGEVRGPALSPAPTTFMHVRSINVTDYGRKSC